MSLQSKIGLILGFKVGDTVMVGDCLVVVRRANHGYTRLSFIGPESVKIQRHVESYPVEFAEIAAREKRHAAGIKNAV